MLKVNDKVKVYGENASGKIVLEGVATIRKINTSVSSLPVFLYPPNREQKGRVHANVEFHDEPGAVYPRFVEESNKVD